MVALEAVPLFAGFSARHLKKLAELAEVASFMAGASIVRQGVVGDSFYVVLEGQAKVVANGRTVSRVRPGDHFGEISLIDGGERTASVVSETPMTLLEISQKQFFDMLSRDPQVTLLLLENMARAVRRLDRSLAG